MVPLPKYVFALFPQFKPSLSAVPKSKHLYSSLKELKTHEPCPIQDSSSYYRDNIRIGCSEENHTTQQQKNNKEIYNKTTHVMYLKQNFLPVHENPPTYLPCYCVVEPAMTEHLSFQMSRCF